MKDKRGTSDELEVLALIISENIGLKKRILDKIRAVRDAKAKREAGAGQKAEKPA